MVKKYVCIPRSFLVIKVCNKGKIPCGVTGLPSGASPGGG